MLHKAKQYTNLPRGIRNNNPLNIRENAGTDYQWEGERIKDDDPEFEEFTNPVYGIRAGARVLASYRRRGVVTLGDIIATWAPPTENDTESYINGVAQATGLQPYNTVEPNHYPALIAAMIRHENGIQPYSMELIRTGVALA
ncbi:hypothetical protein GZ77_03500 [Endozoicomonas montiporae]|uniref:Structural protein P5 n=2 Tax=Endozoicomonas montiporae TaxID=1027273 RepID=A0A081NB37_9GAMM|nr:hypothetical protein GZ77_03500 [Endozoicomonas montiporae]